MNRLRRAPLKRLAAACAAVVLAGGGAAVAASTLGGPTPPPEPLAVAIHQALTAAPVVGVSAHVTLTDGLVPSASVESSSPLIAGGSGRVWISDDGQARLELDSSDGDTELVWNGTTLFYLDVASNTVYEYTPHHHAPGAASGATGPSGVTGAGGPTGASDTGATGPSGPHAVPTIADIQSFIDRLSQHQTVSAATPDDVAGQPAYNLRISPAAGQGGLFAGVGLWWDAVHGIPLRIAIYAAGQTDPVFELTADDVSYGPIDPSVFAAPTASNVVVEGGAGARSGAWATAAAQGATGATGVTCGHGWTCYAPLVPATLAGMNLDRSRVIHAGSGSPTIVATYGQGLGGLLVIERAVPAASSATASGATGHTGRRHALGAIAGQVSLPTVDVNGATGSELSTALGTIISFQRDGVDCVVAGSVTAATALDAARGL